MKYTIRIKNSMFGYERNQTMQVEANSEAEAIAAGKKIDRFANITVEKIEQPMMTGDEIDSIVVPELKAAARSLADTVMLDDLDYDDSIVTLAGILTTIQYYSTQEEYVSFINTLPEEVLDIYDNAEVQAEAILDNSADSALNQNLQLLGFQAYMALAELGFIMFEDMVNLAKLQLQSNGTKH